MATTYDEIFEIALSLPPGFRAMLAEHLLKSLDAAEQAEIDTLWAEEAEKRVQATDSANAHINKWLTQDTPEDAVMTVTGELIRIDFDKRIVVLRYPPTHQEIECIYLEELEDTMIENRRQMIQVTGKFTLNADGHPIKLTDVTRIEALDLSIITLEEIQWANHRFRFREALKLTPTLDEESQQLLVVEETQICLHAFSYTREQLIQEIAEQISFMWDEYVKADESTLAKDALRLRQELLNRLEEVH